MGEITNLKKVLLASVLIMICVFVLPAQAKYGGGTGEPNDPYLIYTAEQMNEIGLSGNSDDWDKHFKLMADIDLSVFTGTEFNVIGMGRPEFGGHEPFTGTFDGNHHIILNFTYETSLRSDSIGIFGSVYGEDSEIKNLTLKGPHVHVGTESFNVGCLAGAFGSGSVYGCRVEGSSVSGANYVGGMFGICRGTISDCFAEGNISGSGSNVGGLAGCNGGGVMSGCYSSGVVFGMGLSVGGLVGTNTGIMSNCNSSASVSGSNGHIGGLAGTNSEGTITKCYSTRSASGYAGIGGLVGNNMDGGTISKCYSTASATGTGWSVGGLVGIMQWDGTIINCYSTGSVSGEAHNIGGLVGLIHIGMVTNCYSTGRVEGSSSLIGGLVGDNESGLITNSFWDVESSGQADSDGGTGLSTEEMQTEGTFTDASWDFATRIWKMCDGPYYPRLWWEICPVRPVYYVDADANGANNGSSWSNAFTELEYALFIARYGDEIHVAQGTYKPVPHTQPPPPPTGESNYSDTTITDSNRTATFQLINGVTIKGGYAGLGEPDPDARDIRLYETILSGDLAGNDREVNEPGELLTDPSRGENSYHALTGSGCDESAVLDGFTITGGNANGTGEPNYHGGGMYNDNGSPILLNCTLASNSAKYDGGGIHSSGGNPQLTNCLFSGNWAGDDAGGIHNDGGNPTLTNCLFSGNRAGEDAGMIYNVCGSPKLTNCTFYANSAGGNTGGIFTINPPAVPPPPPVPIITNCIFWGNRDRTGTTQAAQISWQAGEPLVNFCCIQGWTGTLGGTGNIGADPCFADANNGDCHLKSEAGRWDANSETWIKDDVNSPCIDAGDPSYYWRGELWPHGKRINMGAYGGTPEASMSLSDAANIADLNLDGLLCYRDMKLLTDKWLCETALQAEDLSRDGFVNFTDFAIFAHHFELPPRNPNPADGATGVNITSDLSWTSGRGATSHDVYFGTSNPPPFIRNQLDTIYDSGTMDYSTTYFWRIDEINQWGITIGPVWSFRTIMSPPL